MITPEQHREIEARLERNRMARSSDRICSVCGKKIDESVSIASPDLYQYRHVRCKPKPVFVHSASGNESWYEDAPQAKEAVGVEDEIRDLHEPIILHCRRAGWIYLYSNPRRKTGRTLGEVDFQIWMEQGRKVCFECKARGQELSPAQVIFHRAAFRLGHIVHVVYTMDEFYELVK